jgi:hypothetical protein
MQVFSLSLSPAAVNSSSPAAHSRCSASSLFTCGYAWRTARKSECKRDRERECLSLAGWGDHETNQQKDGDEDA